MRIVRTPLLSTMSDISLNLVRGAAHIVSGGHIERWLGTNGTPMEHQAVECDVCCLECRTFGQYTFEFLGGVGKLHRTGAYSNKYSGHLRERVMAHTATTGLRLADLYDVYYSLPGRWKARHYDAVHNNCQQFARLFWRQLFGSQEDDFAEWQSRTAAARRCGCKSEVFRVRRMKLVRVQKTSDAEQISASLMQGTLGLLSMGAMGAQVRCSGNVLGTRTHSV